MTMNEQLVIEKYTYINDTLSIGVIIQRLGNGNFNPIVAKFNMATGKITPMSYTTHPDVKKKRVCLISQWNMVFMWRLISLMI